MGCCGKFLLFLLLASVGGYFVVTKYFCCNNKHTIPDYTLSSYWGKKVVKDQAFPADNDKIRKFDVKFTTEMIDDLRDRLLQTKYLEAPEGTTFEDGMNPNQLKKIVHYWLNNYNFNQTVKELNKYPHYVTQIEGIDVHYIHIKPTKPKYTKPLVMVHGWPGSFYEYFAVAEILKNEIELIIPSIPGYGFSEQPHKKGFNSGHAARVFVKLLKRLGHEKFIYHGGDWGSIIGRYMATYFPDNVEGVHLVMLEGKFNLKTMAKLIVGKFSPNTVYTSEAEIALSKDLCPVKMFKQIIKEAGYFFIQATKPNTIGALLHDSPAGLAAYILEKFSFWVNPEYVPLEDGGLTKKFTMDQMLTNVMIYWAGGNAGYAVRFYKENIPGAFYDGHYMPRIPKQVVFGYTAYPFEILARFPRFFAEEIAENVAYYSVSPRGGHFGAFEEPTITANELRAFVETVVKNKQEQAQQPKTEL